MNKQTEKIFPEKIFIDNLSFAYNSQIVLKEINLSIKDKEIVTIVGANGGGKTTLLRLILGILKPLKGKILIDGFPPHLVQNRIGYVPQNTLYDRKFPITVYEVVLTGRIKPYGYYNKQDKIKTEEVLEEVELSSYKNELFCNLSGGQMQRMLIARALVTDTKLLLLDEPTSNIDSSTEKRLNSLLKKLNETITIIIVTHDTGFVSNITNRVLCINKTLVEHPFDNNFSETIACSYGDQPMIVRHEVHL